MLTMNSFLPWVGLFGPVVLALVYVVIRHIRDMRGAVVLETVIDTLESGPELPEQVQEQDPIEEIISEATLDSGPTKPVSRDGTAQLWRSVRAHRLKRLAMPNGRAWSPETCLASHSRQPS